jgi:hypothetical protein
VSEQGIELRLSRMKKLQVTSPNIKLNTQSSFEITSLKPFIPNSIYLHISSSFATNGETSSHMTPSKFQFKSGIHHPSASLALSDRKEKRI